MTEALLNDAGFDTLFRQARTYSHWLDKPVSDVLIAALYDLMRNCPTSANASPARFVFLKSREAKEKLKPFLDAGNVEKTMTAPLTVIIAQDFKFYDQLPKLFPHADARSWFVGNDAKIKDTVLRNAAMQGAYLILAARALGLDCGPMSGFDAEGVNKTFFAGTPHIQANFLCNIGHGDASKLHPRLPRLEFAEACTIL